MTLRQSNPPLSKRKSDHPEKQKISKLLQVGLGYGREGGKGSRGAERTGGVGLKGTRGIGHGVRRPAHDFESSYTT